MTMGTKRNGSRRRPPARRRDAAATRAAILASARRAFADVGYDAAGVRQIAHGAGVTAMLVNRYFGSKEQLFAEVVRDVMARPILLTGDRLASARGDEGFADALVALTAAEGEPLDGFRILCRSASSAAAAAIGRAQIEAHYHRALTSALRGPHPAERAALVLALVAGVQIMRQMIGLTALAACPPSTLTKILRPLIHQLWSGRGDPASTKSRTTHRRRRGAATRSA